MATETVVLKVTMSCEGCSGAVRRVLSKMQGVESFDIDMKEQKVTVKGNVKPEDVFQTVSKTGKKTSFWESEAAAPAAPAPAPAPEAAPGATTQAAAPAPEAAPGATTEAAPAAPAAEAAPSAAAEAPATTAEPEITTVKADA